MKNLMISYHKITEDIRAAISAKYPDGFDHAVFEFEVPTRNEIYEAIRVELNDINYIIKLAFREKQIDRLD